MGAANDLIVLFVGLETMSLAFYVLAASYRRKAGQLRERHQVLRARRVLVGVLPLRHRPRLRRRRLDEHLDDGRHAVGHHPRRAQRRARAGRRGPAPRRAGVQGGGGAVPRVDARRVPGRPDAGDRVHGLGRQGRRLRRAACGCSSSPCRSTARTGGRRSGCWPSLSLVVGSFLAVVQTDVKRMLAYSSISHAGFILVGVEAAGHRAGELDSGLGVPSVARLPARLRRARRRDVRHRGPRRPPRRRRHEPRLVPRPRPAAAAPGAWR